MEDIRNKDHQMNNIFFLSSLKVYYISNSHEVADMGYEKLDDWDSGFAHWVIIRHPRPSDHPMGLKKQNGFMGGFITGERGTGKSTYCFKVCAKTYQRLEGLTENEAYEKALNYMMFEPTDFQRLIIYNKLYRIVTPIIVLDDASMHFGKMLHQTNPRLYSALLGETATIRTAVTGFLINAPRRAHVAKFLRDYDDFKGEAKPDRKGSTEESDGWEKKIRFYKWNYYPDEVKYTLQIPFQDRYSCYIPDHHYKAYIDKKRYYEVKHELEMADKISPEARQIFIEHKEMVPEDLRPMVEKWENDK